MQGLGRSFKYAINGFVTAVKEERNMRIHLCAAVYVYVFSLFYGFGAKEYALITFLVAGVMALELVNSAFERTVDHLSPQHNVQAGIIKDMAAAAVLIFCVGAVGCAILLVWDIEVFRRIGTFFTVRWWLLIILSASVAASIWFVFYFKKAKGEKV